MDVHAPSRDQDEEEEEDDDYIDSDDEREEGEKAPHENAFVYIDESGKLVYINPEEDGEGEREGEDASAGLEEKEQVATQSRFGRRMYASCLVGFCLTHAEMANWCVGDGVKFHC